MCKFFMNFNKFLGIICSSFLLFIDSSNASNPFEDAYAYKDYYTGAAVICIPSAICTIKFQENDKYYVKFKGNEYKFNGIEDFSSKLKDIVRSSFDYEDIKLQDNNTIVFNNFTINKNKLDTLTLQSEDNLKKYVKLNFADGKDIYLPRINLQNINSLNIKSNMGYEAVSGKVAYEELNKIYFNDKLIKTHKLELQFPPNNNFALCYCLLRRYTNDLCNIF